MKSVKKVFKKKLSPYNLRSRKSAVPVVKASTPKVNREVQASLSEEENCTFMCELSYYRSSVYESTHAIDLNEETQPSKPSDGPRLSTAFSSPSQADSTNREAINISIDSRQEPSIVQPSSSNQFTPSGPRVESDSSSLEDFTPIDSRHLQIGPQIALEVEEIGEPENEEPDPEQNSNLALNSNPLINSQLTNHSQVVDSINYKKSKQSLFQRREEDISRIVLKEKLSSPPASTAAQPTDDEKLLTALEQLLQKKTAAKEEETVLAKLEALCNRDSQVPDEQNSNEQCLLSKCSKLLEKAARPTYSRLSTKRGEYGESRGLY